MNVPPIVEILLKSFFKNFYTGISGTVAQMTIILYISMNYLVSPMCHLLSSQAVFLFFRSLYMSKNYSITRS